MAMKHILNHMLRGFKILKDIDIYNTESLYIFG